MLAAVALAALPGTALAQQLRGVATTSDGVLLANAVVRVQSPSGRVLGQVRTDDRGRYDLRLSAGGTVAVDVLAVGFQRERAGEVRVPLAGAMTFDIRVARRPVGLSALRVSSKRVCPESNSGDTVLVRLLEQVQASIATSAAALGNPRVTTQLFTFESEQRINDRTVRSLQVRQTSRTGQPPFDAWPADSLAKHGYVVDGADGSTFRAPDLAVLASDEFVRTHCFRAQNTGRSAWSMEFSPAAPPPTNRADISGTLFLSGAQLASDSIHFRYEGLPDWIAPTAAMGWMRFAPAGALGAVVVDWRMTLPITGRKDAKSADGLSRTTYSRQPLSVLATKEVGGRTMSVEQAGARMYFVPSQSASIAIEASSHALPTLLASRYRLQGYDSTFTPSSAGILSLGAVIPGDYVLQVEPPLRDSRANAWTVPIRIEARQSHRVSLKVSDDELIRRLCGSANDREKAGAIVGVARDSSGRPVSTDLQARWFSSARIPSQKKGDRISAEKNIIAAVSDSAGRFLICGLPMETVTVRGDSVQYAGSHLTELRAAARLQFVFLTLYSRQLK